MHATIFKAIFITAFCVISAAGTAAEENVSAGSEKIPEEQFDQEQEQEQKKQDAEIDKSIEEKSVSDTEEKENNICKLPEESKSLPQIDDKVKDYVLYPFSHEFEEMVFLKTGEALVILNDNSRWIIRNFSEEEKELYNQSPWQKRDDIRISRRYSFDRQGIFSLKNLRTNQVYPVHFDNTSLKNAKTYVVEKIDANGYFLTTDNKIDWEIFWTNSWISCAWRPFDRILINKGECAGKNTYVLINLSTQEAVNAEIIQWK